VRVLQLLAQRGCAVGFLEHFRLVRASDGSACARALNDRARVVIEDVANDAQYAPHRGVVLSSGIRAVHSTPIVNGRHEVMGMLSTLFAEPRMLLAEEAAMLDTIAHAAGDVIKQFL
jgi:GAF domain-containing protein